jgi:hypothetical protein
MKDEYNHEVCTIEVWHETHVLPRRCVAAFRNMVDAENFAEHQHRMNEGQAEFKIWSRTGRVYTPVKLFAKVPA